MSKIDKLINRLLDKPKDFTFDEVISFHRPHPTGILKRYILDQVIEKLRKGNLL
ncbi:MAG: hypothetical protein J1F42_05895 [Lachnospiraceae bacterium]|nr:hypothetical protein [Lachnospiraceae bacterium]